jgi:threonylcarbamoyladenosine tRNA methylthiotransferase MtaB
LLEKLVQVPGEFRLRLSSIEATEVTRELIDVMQRHPTRICPHLHISMQSGSDAVLARMRRRWGSQRFLDRCQRVRAALEAPALTTDVIVGFPGESEADFEATCQACRKVGFSKIHIFPFSPRRGTPAAEMPDQVPADVKNQRCRRLAELEAEQRDAYHRSLRGRRLQVLAESNSPERPGYLLGTSCRYATVALPAEGVQRGQLVEVTAGPSHGGVMQAV